MNNILYKYHNNLYVNLTNRCPCACTFCLRNDRDKMGDSDSLWLEREPTVAEVIDGFSAHDMNSYDELVFCGFGEPTERIDAIVQIAKYVKSHFSLPTRLNTNGLGNLINGRDIVPELKDVLDTVSISLNTPDKEDYLAIVRPCFGEESFDAMLSFAAECAKVIPHVVMSTVDTTLTHEQEARCAEICASLGVKYRIREFGT